ncbi:MAG: PTS sugar transporter subunit IIA [Pirellulales bacterium]|nr:PTS sugar transporter subunit IIA [Pirellulales bacterium]
MGDDDFDIDSLAGYLHLATPQVLKMADRGTVPGRKVAGVWRFSRAEIHHWLESRMGALDESELEQLEGALRRSRPVLAEARISIAEMLPLEAIAAPLAAKTRSSVITAMVDLAAGTGLLWDPGKMAEAVRQREDMYPTALDTGVALLHPRRPLPSILAEPFLALGRSDRGIPFGGARGSLTSLFFLICSVDDQGHLRTLARLSRLIADPALLADLRAAPDAVTVREIIAEREQRLSD